MQHWRSQIILLFLLLALLGSLGCSLGKPPVLVLADLTNQPLSGQLVAELKQVIPTTLGRDIAVTVNNNRSRLCVRVEQGAERKKLLTALQQRYLARYYVGQWQVAPASNTAGACSLGLANNHSAAHLVLQADKHWLLTQEFNDLRDQFRSYMRENRIRYRQVSLLYNKHTQPLPQANGLLVQTDKATAQNELSNRVRQKRLGAINGVAPKLEVYTENNKFYIKLRYSTAQQKWLMQQAMTVNQKVLERRLTELSITNALQRQLGESLLVIQVTGRHTWAEVEQLLTTQGTLAAHGVHADHARFNFGSELPPAEAKIVYDRRGKPYLIKKQPVWTGAMVQHAVAGISSGRGVAQSAVHITLDSRGGERNAAYSKHHIKEQIAVVLTTFEKKRVTRVINDKPVLVAALQPKARVINVAVIQSVLARRFEITGLDGMAEARAIAFMIRSGRFRAPMQELGFHILQ